MGVLSKRLSYPAIVVMLMVGLSTAAWAADVVLVANPSVYENSLSQQQVERIFLGKQNSLSRGAIKIVIQKNNAVHTAFLEKYLKKTPSQFDTYYKRLVFTGMGKMPKTVTNDAAVLSYVANTPGALGYVSAGAANNKVKVISVE